MNAPGAVDEPGSSAGSGLVRVRADLAYDGQAFNGWAEQPGLRTVCGVLRSAVELVVRERVRIVVAGRTDAGVHARGQVAHIDLTEGALVALGPGRDSQGRHRASSHPLLQECVRHLLARVRAALRRDADVRLHGIRIAEPGFDARFSALWREYSYRIVDAAEREDPLVRGFTTTSRYPLEADAMNELGAALLGLHDWRSFCRPRDGSTTIRELQVFQWERDVAGALVATVRADAFCHNMVRRLVGAAIEVGRGALSVDDVLAIRAARADTNRYRMAPANGLVLERVGYPDAAALAGRAKATRARRSPLTRGDDA